MSLLLKNDVTRRQICNKYLATCFDFGQDSYSFRSKIIEIRFHQPVFVKD